MNTSLTTQAKFFHGFSDAARLSILLSFINQEATVSKIVKKTGLTQSNVSNHLKCLIGCGLVQNRREGRNIFYSIRDPKTRELLSLSQKIINQVSSEIESCQEDIQIK